MASFLTGCAVSVQPQSVQSPAPQQAMAGNSLRPVAVSISGSDVELSAFLYRPASPGAHPAMLQLHGCGGFRNAAGTPNESYRFWAEHWVRLGLVVLVLDSLTPRGDKEVCTQNARRIRVNVERVRDAYAGLSYLAGLPEVDPARILLQGWSNGGSVTLNALSATAPGRRADGPRFKAAVAYYPGCLPLTRESWRPTAPLLIQSGAADDWTPAQHCEWLAERARANGSPVDIDVYPDAHHSFDRVRQPVRLLPNVGPGRRGAHVGTHPEAREKSLRRTTEWVLAQLR
ncbi:MAG: dienelactone hydrolase family protein [Betaproteobacteria bacterium]|nr:dienelactone hydrolase family protein [Betaproteobacteria bacterium]